MGHPSFGMRNRGITWASLRPKVLRHFFPNQPAVCVEMVGFLTTTAPDTREDVQKSTVLASTNFPILMHGSATIWPDPLEKKHTKVHFHTVDGQKNQSRLGV